MGGLFARRAPGACPAHYLCIKSPGSSPKSILTSGSPPKTPHWNANLPCKARCISRNMRIQQHKMSIPPLHTTTLAIVINWSKGWARFLDTARRFSRLFGEEGAKTGTGGEWSKKDARRAPSALTLPHGPDTDADGLGRKTTPCSSSEHEHTGGPFGWRGVGCCKGNPIASSAGLRARGEQLHCQGQQTGWSGRAPLIGTARLARDGGAAWSAGMETGEREGPPTARTSGACGARGGTLVHGTACGYRGRGIPQRALQFRAFVLH